MSRVSQPRRILTALSTLVDGAWATGRQLRGLDEDIHRGAVYVWLTQLETDGFVRSRGSSQEHLYEYQITSRGRAALLRDDI